MHHLWREYGRKSLRMYYTDYQMSSRVQLDPSNKAILQRHTGKVGPKTWGP